MKKKLYLLFSLFILLILSIPVYADTLTVAAAANVKFVVEDLKKEFKKQTNIDIKTVISSSGKLTSQIKAGAPFDIFLSADTLYPDILYKDGFAQEKTKIYSYGSLVLWSSKDLKINDSLEFLLGNDIEKIAVANPKNAPYGKEAINALKYHKIFEKVKSKIVYGDSIAQVNNYISLNVVDIGITSKSTVVRPNIKIKGSWKEIDKKSYNPIAQGVIILKYAKEGNNITSKKFYDFLFSKKGKEIFKSHGYIIK